MLTRAEIPGLCATALLILTGSGLTVWHWQSWKRDSRDPQLATPFRRSQCLRRVQVAFLIALEGVLLCLGDAILPIACRANLISPQKMAVWWTIDVLFMLLIAVWIARLALKEMAATVPTARRELQSLKERERELHEELERLRKRSDG